MKILLLIGTIDPGGAETLVVSLSKEFVSRGCEVVVGHLGNLWLEHVLGKARIEQKTFEFSSYYRSNLTGPLFVRRLARYIRKHNFDIVHAHLFGMIVFGTFAAKLARVPIVGTIHDIHYVQERKIRAHAYRVVSLLGCRLITVSKNMQSIICNLSGLSARKVRVIYNGIDAEKFEAQNQDADNDIPTVVSTGRLSPEKDFETLMYVATDVARTNPDVKFLIAGSGPAMDDLKQLAKTLGVEENVRFLGQISNVPQLLTKAKVFALSSLTEGLSMSVIEAMAAGKPTVVTDVGGNGELVVEGETGFLVPSGDAKALAEKVCILLKDKALAKRMGAEGKRRVDSKFSQERMIRYYEDVYKTLLYCKN